MSDIATLGLAVDSSQVTKATTALTGLAAAAKPAAAATTELQKAASNLTPIVDNNSNAVNKHSESIRGQRLVLRGMAADLALLGDQYGAAANMAAMLYIDNKHVFEGAGGLKSALVSLITPTNLMIAGFAGLAVGGVLAYNSWKTFALALDDVAKVAGVASGQMSQLQAAAGFHGISTEDFTKGAAGFADQIYQAKNNMGTLVEFLRASGVSAAGDFETVLGKVADLVKRAAGDTNLQFQILKSAGLPATMEWVRFLQQGADGLKHATDEAARFGGVANDEMVAKARAFDEAWNEAWTNFGLYARNGVVNAATAFSTPAGNIILKALLGAVPGGALVNLGIAAAGYSSNSGNSQVANRFPTASESLKTFDPNVKPPPDPNAIKKQISDQQQYISLLGTTASAEQTASLVDLQVQSARLAGIKITNAQAAALHTLAYEQTLGITAIKASTDAQKTEGDTVGMAVGQATAYTAAQNALNEAKRNGRTLTAAETAAIQDNASALGQAAQRTDDLKFGYDAFSGTMRDFETNLRNGMTVWDSFAKAGVNALGKIADRLMDMASRQLWTAAFGGSGGSVGGLLGGLFGGGALPKAGDASFIGPVQGPVAHSGGVLGSSDSFLSRATHPEYFDDAPRFHSGGMVGLNEVPVIAQKGEGVFTPAQMKALAPAAASAPNVTIQNSYTFNGVQPGMQAEMKAYIDQGDQRSTQQAVAAISKISGNSPTYRASISK